MIGVLLTFLVLWGMWQLVRQCARALAQRRLDTRRELPAFRVPPPRRVAPPPRMTLAWRELPAAVLAVLAGPRTRARLRLIVAMRREQSLERYYERLAEVAPPPAWPAGVACWSRPARVKTPNPAEDPAAAVAARIVMTFSVPPPAMGSSVLSGTDLERQAREAYRRYLDREARL
jgi:hypothetical protein